MRRPMIVLSLLAVIGMAAAVATSVLWYARMRAAEVAAAETLVNVGKAQRAFRSRSGHDGYATDVASLMTPCPGDAQAPLDAERALAPNYTLVVRAALGAAVSGSDCHGRPLASDYYAAAEPADALAGRQAFAMTGRARIYVFFDGMAPREGDMRAGGLAVPLDTLDTFKIP